MRILFLTQRLPYAPNRGDRVRAYHLLKEMSQWATVDLVSFVHDAEEASRAGELSAMTSSVTTLMVPRIRNLVRSLIALPTATPLTHTMLDASNTEAEIQRIVRAHPPDVVFAYCSSMARLALLPCLRDVPLVHDMVDVDSFKWAALAESARGPKRWIYQREARLLAAFEADITRHARLTLITTDQERTDLLRLAPGTPVVTLQIGTDLEAYRRPAERTASASPTAVFVGVMNYAPNAQAAVWLATEIWPLVRQTLPDARLQIVGANPTSAVRRLTNPDRGIEVTGTVPDVRPFLWAAAVAVAPLKVARGVQTKVLEAVAAGLPVVVTPAVFKGLPAEIERCCHTADTAEGLAQQIVLLLHRTQAEQRGTSLDADQMKRLAWTTRLQPLRGLLEAAYQ